MRSNMSISHQLMKKHYALKLFLSCSYNAETIKKTPITNEDG